MNIDKHNNQSRSKSGSIIALHQNALHQKPINTCIHSETLVNVSQILRNLCSRKKKQKCSVCCKDWLKKDIDNICFCLHCGNVFCTNSEKNHALEHTLREPIHCLFINIENVTIWCYVCKNDLSSEKNIAPEIEKVKKFVQRKFSGYQVKSIKKYTKDKYCTFKYKSLVPGLQNLGNTCYFNSVWMVMQVLAASHPLHDIVSSTPFSKPLCAQVKGTGSLNSAFIEYLNTVYSCMSENTIFNPQKLFSQIQKEYNQFTPSKQQDAHELLRYFLNSLNMEEFSNTYNKNINEKSLRYRQKTFEKNDISSITDIKAGDLNENNDIKNKNITFVDKLFGGRLASVVVCNTCKSVSTSYEEFQDISLSIKTSTTIIDVDCHTKANNKRIRSKKTRKKRNAVDYMSSSFQTPCSNSNDCSENMSDEGETSLLTDSENMSKMCLDLKELCVDSLEKDEIDSCKDVSAELGISTTIKTGFEHIDLLLSEKSDIDIKKKNSWNLEDSLRQFTSVEILGNENSYACEECAKRLGPNMRNGVDKHPHVFQHRSRVSNAKSSKYCKTSSQMNNSSEPSTSLASDFSSQSSESHVFNHEHQSEQFYYKSSDISSADTSFDSDSSSLSDFQSKPVFSSAFRRFLIDVPLPPILILHLKRFQYTNNRVRSSLKKIDTFVDFPETLDLTDYVVPRLRSGPGLLYMLTGVIVHVGTLTHGHYSCYILTHKIQPLNEPVLTTLVNSNNNSPKYPLRQWVFANDTETRPATWDEVKQSSGYLFVYEQIHT
ncbi:hypothetical protein PCK1_001811 [Pneumocystis canis]|nr:hypothetical protein PCK1_001811 [Pneumocystis canis]